MFLTLKVLNLKEMCVGRMFCKVYGNQCSTVPMTFYLLLIHFVLVLLTLTTIPTKYLN